MRSFSGASLARASSRIACVAALCLLAACTKSSTPDPASAAATPTPAAAISLVGAWESRLQFSNGAFATIKDLRFLYAFNEGGTMTESSNYDGAPPVPPAYGVWRQIGANKFEARYVFYMTKPPAAFQEITSGGGWLPTGHGVLTERITTAADGGSFESTITYEAFDMAGKPAQGGGQAKAHGSRISF
jgi:hypothetical protein